LEDGQLWVRANYKNNRLDGLYEMWDQNSLLSKKGIYRNGVLKD
jgi:antitoxin component YwqK of YwqJK toxin-antitoxin module